jgi:hypothetical protein
MSLQPVASQGSALIEKATKLGVPMDDLLTADGEEVAWTALKDFKATINGVLVEFRKGDPIRERHQINELRNGRCPVASLEATLWRRVKMLPQATDTPPEMVTLKPTLWGGGIDLKELTRRVRASFPWW